ncbi:MAG: lysine--tRNA ligase [Sulfolobales archaeon]
MSLEKWIEDLKRKILRLRELNRDPYRRAYRYDVTSTAVEIRSRYSGLEPGEETNDRYSIAGRVWHIRRHGGITFIDLYDHTGRIQVVARRDSVREVDREILELVDKGDFIGVKGRAIRTKAGEISLLAEEIEILSIAWRPIPFHEFGVKDPEQRYRERYLDILLNSRVRRAITDLYRVEMSMRRILDSKGFVEVHTPKLQPVYGGAIARPFVTRIRALDRDAYLSIAPETYLKRLVVAGIHRVYEIAVCFRNEDIDTTHYPEFVQLEAYMAFADWEDMMSLTEELIAESVREVYGDYKIEVSRESGEREIIDFSRPWKRLSLEEAIESIGGVKIRGLEYEEILSLARDLGVDITDPRRGRIVEKIFEKTVERKLRNPTFITLFPRDISPLARPYREDPRYAERFELYITGMEIANGYSELNNPLIQYQAFREEEELRKRVGREDIESHPMDRDFVRALEYGLPPTGGVGIGLYRLVMVLSGLPSIKDVIPFTYVTPEEFKTVAEISPDLLELYRDLYYH